MAENGAGATPTVELTDPLGGLVATVVDRVWTQAGDHTVTIDGDALADGEYDVVITARTAVGASVQQVVPLRVNRALGPLRGRDGQTAENSSAPAPTRPSDRSLRRGDRLEQRVGTHRRACRGCRAEH